MIRSRRIIALISIAVLALSLWLVVLTTIGYGHLVLDVPAGATVTINGHTIPDTATPIKLRPGTYNISTVSPHYFSSDKLVRISLFLDTHYTADKRQRSPESIAYSADENSGGQPVSNVRWFGDTWILEEVGFSTPSVLVAHYEQGSWVRAYKTGDALDTTKIPTDIIQQVQTSEEAIRASLQ